MDFWILYQQESTVDLMIQVIIDSLINGCIYFFEYHLLKKFVVKMAGVIYLSTSCLNVSPVYDILKINLV